MSGFQVHWRGYKFDLQWGQVATETQDELRIMQADGGAWIIRDVPGHGVRVVFHAAPPDPLLGGTAAPWAPPRRPQADTPDSSQS
ncbi:hypothetical protein [Xanthobacter agilis]|jgi:hypothetical protein|uniref:Uncharacterized protein n=1 Tax=Xanthobacter agilis TaxID=47492 RepID=A0ABU0LG72_XANAG|nr:hypothetical protein [Xanthobacter agilis]MDQ0506136.1 hypothetical protein [Xanthobacter agilis]